MTIVSPVVKQWPYRLWEEICGGVSMSVRGEGEGCMSVCVRVRMKLSSETRDHLLEVGFRCQPELR